MTVTEAVSRIKAAGHDISDEYSTERCREFLNTAIQQVASLLIAANWIGLVQNITVRAGDTPPANFMKTCGSYPVRISGNTITLLNDETSVNVRYYATPSNLDSTSTSLPFNHQAIDEVVVKLAIILALNENEYDISQDSTLVQTLQQAIAGGF